MRKKQNKKPACQKRPIEPSEPQWLRPDEIAARLRVDADTVRRHIHTGPGPIPAGKIPGIRIGRQLRVHVDELASFEARDRRQQATPKIAGRLLSGGKDYFADL